MHHNVLTKKNINNEGHKMKNTWLNKDTQVIKR